MKQRQNIRAQQTQERLRTAAHRLFIRQGYQATSIESILSEASISSKETFYRYYSSKESLFVDVLSHLTLEQPGFSNKLASLPSPHDLPSLHQALLQLSRELLTMMCQPGYLTLVRTIIAETPRFPELGTLFFSTVTQRGFTIIAILLQTAREQQIIAEIDVDVVTRMLLGGLLSYAITGLIFASEQTLSPPLDRSDALIEVIMRALKP